MSASASLLVDVEAVVVVREVTGREVTADVMLAARARRVHHLESSLPNCEFCLIYMLWTLLTSSSAVVDLDVAVELLLQLLSLAFCSACSCIRQKYLTYS